MELSKSSLSGSNPDSPAKPDMETPRRILIIAEQTARGSSRHLQEKLREQEGLNLLGVSRLASSEVRRIARGQPRPDVVLIAQVRDDDEARRELIGFVRKFHKHSPASIVVHGPSSFLDQSEALFRESVEAVVSDQIAPEHLAVMLRSLVDPVITAVPSAQFKRKPRR